MKFIVRYVRRDNDDREYYRDFPVAPVTDRSPWQAVVGHAYANAKSGERIVRISEAGYHD